MYKSIFKDKLESLIITGLIILDTSYINDTHSHHYSVFLKFIYLICFLYSYKFYTEFTRHLLLRKTFSFEPISERPTSRSFINPV